MAKGIVGSRFLDLTNPGGMVVIDTSGIDLLGLSSPNHDNMGLAVAEVVKIIGGVTIPFSPAMVLDATTGHLEPFTVDGIGKIGIMTITAAAVPALSVAFYGEETQ